MGLRPVWLGLLAVGLAFSATSPMTGIDTPNVDDCPVDVPEEPPVTCGTLTVPENQDQPDGPTIELPYIILHSTADDPEPDPIVFTAGGPGDSSLKAIWSFARSPLLNDRDIIIFEQRGNRYAQPALHCDRFVWEETIGDTPCLDSIRARGIDLTTYTTDSMAGDIIALRRALDLEQWNLYGSSFSTSLMLLIMEADPDATRSAILQSVKPPSETTFAHEADSPLRAIEHIFDTCRADDDCAAAFPDLEDRFLQLIRQLNDTPVPVQVTPAGTTESIPIEMDGDRFIDWIVLRHLYGPVFPPHGAAYLPLLISEVHGGNTEALEPAAQSFWNATPSNPNWTPGLLLAVNCQQDLPAAGAQRPEADVAASQRLDGFLRSTSQRDICRAWDLTPQAPAGNEYIRSSVPTLVLAGSFDPVTPPVWSRTAARHLDNSTYVEFPGYGHDVMIDNPCADDLIAAFADEPTVELDTECVALAPKPHFVTSGDVYLNPKLARSRDEMSLGKPQGVAWLEALAATSIYGMLALLAGLSIGGGLWLWRRGHDHDASKDRRPIDWTAPTAYGIGLAVIVATLAIPVLLTEINQAQPNPIDLGVVLGPNRDLPATLVAWITPLTGVLVVALAALTLWAIVDRRWPGLLRATSTLVVLCALPMMYLGLRWGLFTMLW